MGCLLCLAYERTQKAIAELVFHIRGCLQLSSAVMRTFALNCHHIEFLCLAGCRSASAASVAYFLASLPFLKSLDVSGLASISNNTLEIISHHCSNLTMLNASYCRSLTVTGLSSIAKRCSKLMDLQLAHCTGLDDEALFVIASLPQLKRLNIAHCPLVTDHGLVHLSKSLSMPVFRLLNVSNCPQVSDAGLTPLVTEAKGLKTLELANCRHLTDNAVSAISMNCSSLEHLDLEECIHITDAALNGIALHLSTCIKAISLSYCDSITDEGAIALLRGCQHLERLELDNCSRITDQLLRAIGVGLGGGQLRELELWDCRGVSQGAIYQLVKAISNANNSNSGQGAKASNRGDYSSNSVPNTTHSQRDNQPHQHALRVRSFYTRSHERRPAASSGNANVSQHSDQGGVTRQGRPSCTVF